MVPEATAAGTEKLIVSAARHAGRGAALVVIALALTVAGCGRRGRLEPPPNPDNPFQFGTPKPPPDASGTTDESRTGLPKNPKNPPIRPPNEAFILDPLL